MWFGAVSINPVTYSYSLCYACTSVIDVAVAVVKPIHNRTKGFLISSKYPWLLWFIQSQEALDFVYNSFTHKWVSLLCCLLYKQTVDQIIVKQYVILLFMYASRTDPAVS